MVPGLCGSQPRKSQGLPFGLTKWQLKLDQRLGWVTLLGGGKGGNDVKCGCLSDCVSHLRTDHGQTCRPRTRLRSPRSPRTSPCPRHPHLEPVLCLLLPVAEPPQPPLFPHKWNSYLYDLCRQCNTEPLWLMSQCKVGPRCRPRNGLRCKVICQCRRSHEKKCLLNKFGAVWCCSLRTHNLTDRRTYDPPASYRQSWFIFIIGRTLCWYHALWLQEWGLWAEITVPACLESICHPTPSILLQDTSCTMQSPSCTILHYRF